MGQKAEASLAASGDMDAIDARIIRGLHWHPLNPVDVEGGSQGVWDIARGLKVHGNTVKRRLRDMEHSGVLKGFQMIANPPLVGKDAGTYAYHFDDPAACGRAEQEVLGWDLPGATERLDGHELRFAVVVSDGESLGAAADRFGRDLGASRWNLVSMRSWPCEAITDLDRRIMGVYHENALTPASVAAERVGVTAKTVRNRIRGLMERRAFSFLGMVDYVNVTGLVPFHLDVDTGGQAPVAHRILRARPDLNMATLPTAPVFCLTGLAESQGAITQAIRQIRSMDGVLDVRVRVLESFRAIGLIESGILVSDAVERLEAAGEV